MNEHQTFSAELASLYPMLGFLQEKLEGSPFSEPEKRKIELALEEALVNIISYAYQGKPGTITLHICIQEGDVEITIEDEGLPFNPLSHKKEIDPLVPIEELKEGGLGILLMQKLMDRVNYQRVGEKNILTLQKKHPF